MNQYPAVNEGNLFGPNVQSLWSDRRATPSTGNKESKSKSNSGKRWEKNTLRLEFFSSFILQFLLLSSIGSNIPADILAQLADAELAFIQADYQQVYGYEYVYIIGYYLALCSLGN